LRLSRGANLHWSFASYMRKHLFWMGTVAGKTCRRSVYWFIL
jgi:hypothetical protein